MASSGIETWQTSWGRTDLKLRGSRYLWTICNFSFCTQDTGKAMYSPAIFGPIEGPRWKLCLYPRGNREASKNHISLFLIPCDADQKEEKNQWLFKYEFTLLNSRKEPICDKFVSDPGPLNFNTCGGGRGCGKMIARDELIRLLKDDQLNIRCEIIIFDGHVTETSGQSDNTSNSSVPECTLSIDLESTFKEQKFGDTIIEVADKEFLVYRGILQSRSPVFAAMFQHELEEKKQNRVVITDAKPNIIEEILTYIYTGRSPNIEVMTNDLLPIAGKYNLEWLKTMSENVMSRNLTRGNAIETLISADLYRANQLKKNVINFIIAESSHFLEDAAWENLRSSLSKTPDLLIELTKALFRAKK